jgi:hypothetical protein
MSRPSLPSTPLPGSPTLHIPSPTRTPSPLRNFAAGGPYTYTGQITRKYASRFNEINKKRNNVKDVEGAWEKEAMEKGVAVEALMKNSEVEYTWEDESIPRVERILLQDSIQSEAGKNETNDSAKSIKVVPDMKLSIEEEHFVDALTSPIEKPKNWVNSLEVK